MCLITFPLRASPTGCHFVVVENRHLFSTLFFFSSPVTPVPRTRLCVYSVAIFPPRSNLSAATGNLRRVAAVLPTRVHNRPGPPRPPYIIVRLFTIWSARAIHRVLYGHGRQARADVLFRTRVRRRFSKRAIKIIRPNDCRWLPGCSVSPGSFSSRLYNV